MDILPQSQRELWPHLTPARHAGFVLYGGTAIALRLGHRQSVDFDFFTHNTLDKAQLFSILPFLTTGTVIQDAPESLTLIVPVGTGSVKLSFFGTITMGRVGEPESTADGTLLVASRSDLLTHKLKVILQRIEAKDYRDIAALLADGARLEEGLAGARALFGKAFQPNESLKALVYFQGGDLDTLTQEEQLLLVDSVKRVRNIHPTAILSTSLDFS
jgi:hypothetical protein